MTRQRHAIPTGLAVEDRFLTYWAYSLSMRQFLILVAGIAVAYGTWQDHPGLTLPLRTALPAATLAVAAVVALARPAGQPPERWAFVLARYRRTRAPALWRPLPAPAAPRRGADAALVGLTPIPRWGAGDESTAGVGAGEEGGR